MNNCPTDYSLMSFSSSFVAIRQSLCSGRSYSPSAFFTRTFLTHPSFSGYVRTMIVIFHWHRLCFGSNSKTRSPSFAFSLVRNHLFPGRRFGAKYFIQQRQNSFTRLSVLLIIFLGFTLSWYSGCGGVLCWPNRMSLGVIGGLSQMLSELG